MSPSGHFAPAAIPAQLFSFCISDGSGAYVEFDVEFDIAGVAVPFVAPGSIVLFALAKLVVLLVALNLYWS